MKSRTVNATSPLEYRKSYAVSPELGKVLKPLDDRIVPSPCGLWPIRQLPGRYRTAAVGLTAPNQAVAFQERART
jgi:hypothetical protein